jgi:hypothetical protein
MGIAKRSVDDAVTIGVVTMEENQSLTLGSLNPFHDHRLPVSRGCSACGSSSAVPGNKVLAQLRHVRRPRQDCCACRCVSASTSASKSCSFSMVSDHECWAWG